MQRARRKCLQCRSWFRPTRSDARFCKAACRQLAYRQRHDPHRRQPSKSECDRDHEHERVFPDDPDWVFNRNAADWQLDEGLRLAEEFALLRPGTRPQDITRARIAEVRKIANAWKELAAELRRQRRAP
jgi:hypothetical protein